MAMSSLTNAQMARNAVYNIFMKRTSTYMLSLTVCAFVGLKTMSSSIDYVWNTRNKGRRFEDIHKTFPVLEAEDDDE